ncbi:unnamed protein product [Strongylus vulgaris]|uniref:Uncharacterized protein n=1 Tax=Strongylus vulgaris TaxID=40348 RepID=A0A3P7JKX9_STRVU|nr:unnamed protein product [Strongylus vulgaris]
MRAHVTRSIRGYFPKHWSTERVYIAAAVTEQCAHRSKIYGLYDHGVHVGKEEQYVLGMVIWGNILKQQTKRHNMGRHAFSVTTYM